jgi:Do/DeqQ family serine protease
MRQKPRLSSGGYPLETDPPMRVLKVLLPFLTVLAACSPHGGHAQANLPEPTRTAPMSAMQMKLSFAPVVKKAAPAVVNISAKRVVREQVDPFWQMFGAGAPRDHVEGSLGSGVIVREDGVIVTNNHVIEGGQEITVSLADRREFPAKVLLADQRTDLAVLKISLPAGEKLPVIPIDDRGAAQVGDLVLAIGDPFGVGQTVTNGIISALNRSADPSGGGASAYIQTDAAINPGNSGGPLVDMDGDLIGINSFIVSRSGGSVGVGFAIPAPLVKRVVETALGGGHAFVRPWLGVRSQAVTSDIAQSLGMAAPRGVLAAEIWPGGAAQRGGLRQGDVILAVDGKPIDDEAGLNYAVGAHKPGDTIRLTVRRDGSEQAMEVRAEAPPSQPAKDERTLSGRNPLQGATVINLSPATADELGVDPFLGRGVLITNISNGIAAQAGLRPGDLVRAINGKPVNTVSDLAAALTGGGRGWSVTIERGGQRVTANFQL